jgi:hypothetical protein
LAESGQKVGPALKDGILLDDSKCKSEMTGGKMSLTKEGIAIRQAPPGVESADELLDGQVHLDVRRHPLEICTSARTGD